MCSKEKCYIQNTNNRRKIIKIYTLNSAKINVNRLLVVQFSSCYGVWWQWGKRVLELGGPAFHTYVPMAWGEKYEQSMLGVGGVFDDGGSSPVDSAVVNAKT